MVGSDERVFLFQIVGGVILGLALLSQVLTNVNGGNDVRKKTLLQHLLTEKNSQILTCQSPVLPPAAVSDHRPHHPLHRGHYYHGHRHPGGLRGPQGEQRVPGCGEFTDMRAP